MAPSQRTASKAVFLSQSFGKVLDISNTKIIPLDLSGIKIHKLETTLRLLFYFF